MKKFHALILVVVVIGSICSALLWKSSSSLNADLHSLTQETRTLLEEAIALKHEASLTLQQQELFADLERILPTLNNDAPFDEQIAAIGEIRQAISQLIAYTDAKDPIRETRTFQALLTMFDEKLTYDEMRIMYNASAHEWNAYWRKWLFMPFMTIGGFSKAQLINENGSTAYDMVIEL